MTARNVFTLSVFTIVLSLDARAAVTFNTSFSPIPLLGGSPAAVVILAGITPPSQAPIVTSTYSISFSSVSSVQGVVQGDSPLPTPLAFIHAVPVAGITGGTTAQYLTGDFGSALTTNRDLSRNYLSTGFIGGIAVTFTEPMYEVEFLWGSVDNFNFLSLNDASNTIISGSQIIAATPGFSGAGAQGAFGSVWVRINSTTPFTTISATSLENSFEFGAIVATNTPEPNTLFLSGLAFAMCGAIWLRRTKSARLRAGESV